MILEWKKEGEEMRVGLREDEERSELERSFPIGEGSQLTFFLPVTFFNHQKSKTFPSTLNRINFSFNEKQER